MTILEETRFSTITIVEESKPYEKGKITVSSFTVSGQKVSCNCGN